jgi:hypothetical protein
MALRILAISVACELDTPYGPQQAVIDLASMHRHCRPERVEDLLEDLTVLCEDVQAGRKPEDLGHPVLSVIQGSQ